MWTLCKHMSNKGNIINSINVIGPKYCARAMAEAEDRNPTSVSDSLRSPTMNGVSGDAAILTM
jgi:hypothetical protein